MMDATLKAGCAIWPPIHQGTESRPRRFTRMSPMGAKTRNNDHGESPYEAGAYHSGG